MTKAKTVGKRRAGRKRSYAHREKNGREKRVARKERRDEVTRTVCAARCRRLGMPNTEANRAKVAAREFGSLLGTLFETKLITRAQCDAGWRMADLEADYKRTMGFPRPFAACAAYGEITGGGKEPSADQVTLMRVRYANYKQVFNYLGVLPRSALVAVALNEDTSALKRNGIVPLRIGLDAMAEHFKTSEAKAA